MRSDKSPSQKSPAFVLSAEEEITLRRVAYGLTEVRFFRPEDLDRLRDLRLIEDGRDGPRLTPAGRYQFDGLRRGVFATPPRHSDFRLSAPPLSLPESSRPPRGRR